MSDLELKGLRLLRNLETSFTHAAEGEGDHVAMTHVSVEFLQPGKYQPRKHMDEAVLQELANSIKTQGIIQPLIVRKTEYGHYEIIAGERRWRAAMMAGLSQVPVIIKVIEDKVALAFSLIENIQRENLSPLEEAESFYRFHEEFSMTHEEIAQTVGRSRVSITNTLRLLSLEPRVRTMLEEKQIDMGHARALLTLEPEQQYQVAIIVVDKGLNVRATEKLANSYKLQNDQPTLLKTNDLHEQCTHWQKALSSKFMTQVSVKLNKEGKGQVVIHVNSADEVEWLMTHLKVRE